MLSSFLKYSSSLLMSNVFFGLLSFLATMVSAKILTKSQFGEFNHYVLIYSSVSSLILSGSNSYLVYFININRSKNLELAKKIVMQFFFILLLLTIICVFSFWLNVSVFEKLSIIAIALNVLIVLSALIFRSGMNPVGEITVRSSVSLINTSFFLGFIFLYKNESVPVFADFLSLLIVAIILSFFFIKSIKLKKIFFNPFGEEYSALWGSFRPLWLAGALFSLNTYFKSLFVDYYLGIDELAIMSFVMAVWMLVMRPIEMFQRSILPALTYHEANIDDEFLIMRFSCFMFTLIGISVASIYTMFLSTFGYYEYSVTLEYFCVLCFGLPVMSVEFILASLSVARGHHKVNRESMLWSVCIVIPVGLLLIYRFSLMGAFITVPLFAYLYCSFLMFNLRLKLTQSVNHLMVLVLSSFVPMVSSLITVLYFQGAWMSTMAIPVFILTSRFFRMWSFDLFKAVYCEITRGGG